MSTFPVCLPRSNHERKKLLAQLAEWRQKTVDDMERLQAVADLDWSTAVPPLRLGEQYTDVLPTKRTGRHKHHGRNMTCTLPGYCPHLQDREPRPIPPTFESRAHDTVYISAPLQIGTGHAQLYRGTLGPADDPTAAHVVVKIYQSSLFSPEVWKESLSSKPGRSNPWFNVLQQFRVEHWAYDRLRPLQGTLVPHVYGFFQVLLPSGEPCMALVMEHIDAIRPRRHVGRVEKDNLDLMASVANGLLSGLHAMHACGVGWLDMAARNILFQNPQLSRPIFIDFALAQEATDSPLYTQLLSIPHTMERMGFERDICLEWLIKHLLNPEVGKLFDLASKESSIRFIMRSSRFMS